MIPPDTLHGIKGVRSALLCNSTRLNSWIFFTTKRTMTHKFSSTPLYPTLGKVHSATLQLSIFAGAIFPYRLQYWRRTPPSHYFVFETLRTASHYLKLVCCLLFFIYGRGQLTYTMLYSINSGGRRELTYASSARQFAFSVCKILLPENWVL